MNNITTFTLIILSSLIWIGCSNTESPDEETNTSWVFVANEGNLGSTNGSISMIDEFGNVYETETLGDVVQSLEVYGDKLIVLINNSHMIKIYNITPDGLTMPGIEITTSNSSPRDLVVVDAEGIKNDKVYFTNWNSQDVKVLNLFNYDIEASIPINGLPEDIMIDGTDLWVTINMNPDWSAASTIVKIDMNSNAIIETYEVGPGPQELAKHNGEIYVSRTFYNKNWVPFHGATKIGEEILINNYGEGSACGGSILSFQNVVFRSFDGGLSKMHPNLDLDLDSKIGNYDQTQVYHVEEINGNFWFALTNFSDYNELKVVSYEGIEITSYDVGINPGDLAYWTKSE